MAADENVGEELPIPASWTDSARHFALQVSGDSMSGAGILDGDYVIVRQQSDAADGEVIAATIDGETTLKRLRRKGRRKFLVAENPAYTAISIKTEDAHVHGVVVGVLRSYRTPRTAMRSGGRAC